MLTCDVILVALSFIGDHERTSTEIKVMKQTASKTSTNSEGFLLLNSDLNPIFFNRAAAEILCYPHKVETQKKPRRLSCKASACELGEGRVLAHPNVCL